MLKFCFSRSFYLAEFFLIAALLLFAAYLQFIKGLIPCTLCEMQRAIFAILGLVFLLAAAIPPKKLIIMHILANLVAIFFALWGSLFAARQVYLQHFPPAYSSISTCGASLHYLFKVMSFEDVLLSVFFGGAECAKVDWQFLGLSIANWALFGFILILLLALGQCVLRIFSRRIMGGRKSHE